MKIELKVMLLAAGLCSLVRVGLAQDADVDAGPEDTGASDALVGDSVVGDSANDAGTADGGARPWASVPSTFAAYAASETAFSTAWCTCYRGMTTQEECIQNNEADTDSLACQQAGYDALPASAGKTVRAEIYQCRAWANERARVCVAALGTTCGTWNMSACQTAWTADRRLCPTVMQGSIPQADLQASATAANMCATQRLVGTGVACSDTSTPVTEVGDNVFAGNTRNAGNNTEPRSGCAMNSSGGADVSFRWTATAAGMYEITTANSAFDTVLYVRSACADATDFACNDDASDQDVTSSVNIAAQAGQTFVITVDGFAPSELGPFGVSITRTGGLRDAGTRDAGSDAGGPPPASSGCGCVVAGTRSNGAAWFALLAFLPLIIARRRSS